MATVTPQDCLKKYGPADKENNMCVFAVPQQITAAIPVIPQRIYCNKDLATPITSAFNNLITRGFSKELKTWDGCFNNRSMRGASAQSLHSWGIAIDVNAATNALGATPALSAGFVKCFIDAGFEWGGTWARKDGMHFQLARI